MRKIAVMLLVVAGCATHPAVSGYMTVRREAKDDCAARCTQAGMQLGAVVLIMNSEGCVCEPVSSQGQASSNLRPSVGAAAVAAGVLVAEEEEKQRKQSAPGQEQATPASSLAH